MKDDGYSFSLADGAFVELISQRERQAIQELELGQMISGLSRFLNPNLPIMPGMRDILVMIGEIDAADNWSESEVSSLSQRAWDMLRSLQTTAKRAAAPMAPQQPTNDDLEPIEKDNEWNDPLGPVGGEGRLEHR